VIAYNEREIGGQKVRQRALAAARGGLDTVREPARCPSRG